MFVCPARLTSRPRPSYLLSSTAHTQYATPEYNTVLEASCRPLCACTVIQYRTMYNKFMHITPSSNRQRSPLRSGTNATRRKKVRSLHAFCIAMLRSGSLQSPRKNCARRKEKKIHLVGGSSLGFAVDASLFRWRHPTKLSPDVKNPITQRACLQPASPLCSASSLLCQRLVVSRAWTGQMRLHERTDASAAASRRDAACSRDLLRLIGSGSDRNFATRRWGRWISRSFTSPPLGD